MTDDNKPWFDGIEVLVSEPLRFKEKLAIGEDAYRSLKVKRTLFEAWDALGVASTAAAIASTSAVASYFFAPTGFWGWFRLGTAVTPIGWVIAAGVVTGGAWLGITKLIKGSTAERITIIPKSINTPLDLLAVGLFNLIAPLALKMAAVDGRIDKTENDFIKAYLISEWGYSSVFVEEGITFLETDLDKHSIKEVAKTLAEFKKANPDCNYDPMSKEILGFLRGVMEAGGTIDEREEMAFGKVQAIFADARKSKLTKQTRAGLTRAVNSVSGLVNKRTDSSKDKPDG